MLTRNIISMDNHFYFLFTDKSYFFNALFAGVNYSNDLSEKD